MADASLFASAVTRQLLGRTVFYLVFVGGLLFVSAGTLLGRRRGFIWP